MSFLDKWIDQSKLVPPRKLTDFIDGFWVKLYNSLRQEAKLSLG